MRDVFEFIFFEKSAFDKKLKYEYKREYLIIQ